MQKNTQKCTPKPPRKLNHLYAVAKVIKLSKYHYLLICDASHCLFIEFKPSSSQQFSFATLELLNSSNLLFAFLLFLESFVGFKLSFQLALAGLFCSYYTSFL